MLEDSIREWNPWWAEGAVPESLLGEERDLLEDLHRSLKVKHVKDIIGVRRAGKTTLMYQLIQRLISEGVSPKRIVFLNFDDPEIGMAPFPKLLEAIYRITPRVDYLFLDEVQQREGWERWVRTQYDTSRFRQIIVSGSSASLLSRDVSRVLTGRHITFRLRPFSFREYLRHVGWRDFSVDRILGRRGELLYHLRRYLEEGGFPEVAGKDEYSRKRILVNLFRDIVERDVAARHGVDADVAERIAFYLISNISKEYSLRRVAAAAGVSVETTERHISHLVDSFLFYRLRLFSYSVRQQFRENKKIYCVDTGLVNAVAFKVGRELGRALENAVFLKLEDDEREVYYWKDRKGEVDFLLSRGSSVEGLLQVCVELKEREFSSLKRAMEFYGVKRGVVVTENTAGEEDSVELIPAWRFLLN